MINFYIKLNTATELKTFLFLLENQQRIKERIKNSMLWNFHSKKENVYYLQMNEMGFYSSLKTINFDKKNVLTFKDFFNKNNY